MVFLTSALLARWSPGLPLGVSLTMFSEGYGVQVRGEPCRSSAGNLTSTLRIDLDKGDSLQQTMRVCISTDPG